MSDRLSIIGKHSLRDCDATKLSTSLVNVLNPGIGVGVKACSHCALPCGNQDKFNFHGTKKIGGNCDTGFKNVAEAVAWHAFRKSADVIHDNIAGVPKTEDGFSVWLGRVDLSKYPWPNVITVFLLVYESFKNKECLVL